MVASASNPGEHFAGIGRFDGASGLPSGPAAPEAVTAGYYLLSPEVRQRLAGGASAEAGRGLDSAASAPPRTALRLDGAASKRGFGGAESGATAGLRARAGCPPGDSNPHALAGRGF